MSEYHRGMAAGLHVALSVMRDIDSWIDFRKAMEQLQAQARDAASWVVDGREIPPVPGLHDSGTHPEG